MSLRVKGLTVDPVPMKIRGCCSYSNERSSHNPTYTAHAGIAQPHPALCRKVRCDTYGHGLSLVGCTWRWATHH